jgi:hypothetical protein
VTGKDPSHDKKQSGEDDSGLEDADRLTLKQLASTMLEPETLEQLRRAEQLTGIQPPPNQSNLPQPSIDQSQFTTNPQRLPGGGFQIPRKHSVLDGSLSGANPVIVEPNAQNRLGAGQKAPPINSAGNQQSIQNQSYNQSTHPPAAAKPNSVSQSPPAYNPGPALNQGSPPANIAPPPNQSFAPTAPPNSNANAPAQPNAYGHHNAAPQNAPPQPQGYNAGVPVAPHSGRPRKGITRTAIDMIVSFGSSLTGKQAMGDAEYSKMKPSVPAPPDPYSTGSYGQHQSAQHQSMQQHGGQQQGLNHSSVPQSNASSYSAQTQNEYTQSPQQYQQDPHLQYQENPQQYQQGAQPQQPDSQQYQQDLQHQSFHDQTHEPHERVPKTLLDVSVLDQITLSNSAKKVLQAAEDAKLRALEPVKQFVPVEASKRVSSCPFKWADEDSKDKFRYCDRCQKQIYNFKDMELPQAEALIFSRENVTAPVLYKRPDGKFMTSACPSAAQARSKVLFYVVAALVVIGCVFFLVSLSLNSAKPTAPGANGGSSATSGSQTPGGSSDGRRRRKDSSSGDFSDSTGSGGTSSSGGSTSAPSASPGAGASNGGYGPSTDSNQGTWQWEYDKSQQSAARSTPPPAPVRKSSADENMTDAQKAELDRLRNSLRLQGTPAEKLDQ